MTQALESERRATARTPVEAGGYDPIIHLATVSGSTWLCMIGYAAYLDDSGTHDGSPCVCLTGFVANVPRWKELSRAWGKCLDKHGVTYYHAKELERLKGPYVGWTERKAEAFRNDLLRAITDNLSAPITSSTQMTAYRELVNTPKLRALIGTPTTLAMKGILINLVQYASEQGITEPIEFVLDAGMKNVGEVRVLLDRLHANDSSRQKYLVGPNSSDAVKQCNQLQAADLHAYETWKANVAEITGDPTVRVRARTLLAPFGREGTYDLA